MSELELRRKRFKIALAFAGLTQKRWARRVRIHNASVSHQLTGRRDVEVIRQKIDAFVGSQLDKLCYELCAEGGQFISHGGDSGNREKSGV